MTIICAAVCAQGFEDLSRTDGDEFGLYSGFGLDFIRSAQDPNPKGPSTQYLGTWGLGNSNYSTGFGQVYDY